MTKALSFCDRVLPLDQKGEAMVGSTDVGDVSWAVPTVQAHGATFAIGTQLHSWQMTSQGKMPAAHKGMVHVAKVMAATAVAALVDETLIPRAKAEHQARLKDTPYISPLPKDVEPPLEMSKIAS